MAEILPLLLLNAVLLPLLLAKSKDQSECVQMWLKKRPELLDRFQKNQISWLCDRTEEWMTKALNPGKSFDDTLTPLQRNYLNQLRTCKSVDCFENRTAFCTGPNNSHADSTSKPHTGWVPKPLNPKRKTPKNENKVELDDIDLSTIDDVNVDDLLKDDLGKPDKNIKRDLMARVCQQIFNSTDSHLNKTEDKSVRNRYNRYKTKCTKVIQELEKRHETLDSWLSDKMDQNLDDSDLTAIDSFNENISPDKTSQAERFKVAKFCTKILSPGQKLSDHKKLSNLARDKLQKNLLKWRSKCQKIDKNLKKDQHSFADWLIKSSDTAANQTSDDEKRRNLAQLCLKVLKSTTSAEAFPNAKASDEVKHQQFINWRRKCLEIQERMESLNITLNHWLNQNHTDNKSETHNGTSSAIITSTSNPIVVENNVTNSNNSQRNEKSKDHEEKGKAKSDNKNEENNKERGKSGDKNKGGGKDGEDRKTEGKGGKNEKHDEEQKKEEKSKSDKKSKEKDQKNGNNGQHKGEEKKEEKGKPDKKSDAKGGNGQKPRSKRQTAEIPDVADLSGFIEANLKPSADVPQVADIRARRKEYRMMTPSERQKLHAAFNRLKTEKIDGTSKYDLLVVFHVPEEAPGAHWGPAFLPFHRELLKQ